MNTYQGRCDGPLNCETPEEQVTAAAPSPYVQLDLGSGINVSGCTKPKLLAATAPSSSKMPVSKFVQKRRNARRRAAAWALNRTVPANRNSRIASVNTIEGSSVRSLFGVRLSRKSRIWEALYCPGPKMRRFQNPTFSTKSADSGHSRDCDRPQGLARSCRVQKIKLTPHQKREALERRNRGNETLADPGGGDPRPRRPALRAAAGKASLRRRRPEKCT